MEKREFKDWLSNFKKNITSYNYYTDFNKVYYNINSVKVELNILNSLIGSKNIEIDFEKIISKYPETLKCIPILLAVRLNKIPIIDKDFDFIYDFNNMNHPIEKYKIFMNKTGLFTLLEKHLISNLIDYATGVEVGLDSHGRKNRSGHLMENIVEQYLIEAGFTKDTTYFKEIKINEIEKKFNIDLSAISNKGKTVKRFDFVVKNENNIYAIETNFYNVGGSKLNETARSYKQIAQEINSINKFSFIWITDGKGWIKARNNLEETFDTMEHLYSINDLENEIMKKIFK